MSIVAAPFYSTFDNKSFYSSHRTWIIGSIFLISIIFGFIFGMRWDVGTDNLEYLRIYTQNDTERYAGEFIFKFINDSFYHLRIHYWIYFGLYAFIQIFLVFFALRKESFLWIFLIFALYGGHFFVDWMNGMRQEMASCIMLFGTNYIITRKPLKYLLCVICAAGFHSSAIMFLLIYPIVIKGKSLVPNKYLQLSALIICSGITLFVGDILSHIFPILDVLKQVEMMDGYTNTYNENVLQGYSDKTHIGIMFYLFFILNGCIILYSSDILAYFKGRRITIYYNLYYWGMLFETLLATNMVLIRPFRYFRIYKMIMLAYLLYYLYKHPSPVSKAVFITILLLLIIGVIIKTYTTPFNFFFEIPYAP